MPHRLGLFALLLALAACAKRDDEPAPAPPPSSDRPPDFEDQHTFVSTSNNAQSSAKPETSGGPATDGAYAVTSVETAKQLAETAIADYLDPKKTWKTSPVLPSTWPVKERAVVFFFYPMAANPHNMTHFQLFSPWYRVKVSLTDGTTAIEELGKRKQIGTFEDKRASSLERRELDMAESSLVQQLTGVQIDDGDQPYWGYLKFIHEHPQLGKDLERRNPAFLGWVRKRYGK
jgi:hypothetical protein